MSPEERINAEVFKTALEEFGVEQKYREYEDPSFSGHGSRRAAGCSNANAYRNYIKRLGDMPRYIDEQIVNMRAGLKRGFTKPQVSLAGRDAPIEPLASDDVDKNPLFTSFAAMPGNIPESERAALVAEGRAAVSAAAPAFAKLRAFVRDEYIPKARTAIAGEALPEGKAYYAAKIRQYTTLDLTPEQIHEIGIKEVARIDADMQATMKAAGWKGDFAGFLHFLKTDPQFTAQVAVRADGEVGLCREQDQRPAQIPRRPSAALSLHDPADPGQYRALRDRRQRRARELPDEHLQPAGAAALYDPAVDRARMRAGPQLPGRARARGARPAADPPHDLFLGLWRGLGTLYRMARHPDGHLRNAL